MLVASPCAGSDETSDDAGLAAAVSLAETSGAGAGAAADGSGVTVEPWTALDGVGVVAHDHARPGESPQTAARRIADVAARSFAATPLERSSVARARSALFAAADTVPARALATVAEAVSPGRPSWMVAQGTALSLGRASDAEVVARAIALRTGPVRVAILASDDEAQVTAAAQAVDRWMIRRPGGDRACPQVPMPPAPHPGTYPLPLPKSSAATEAWLALPLPDHDRPAFAAATWLADALDGEGGLLDRALVGDGLVRSASARVVGSLARGRAALVVQLDAPPGSLDAAVAQTRVLLDRLRQGALGDADLARAAQRHGAQLDAARTTPRGRLVELFRERDPRHESSGSVALGLARLRRIGDQGRRLDHRRRPTRPEARAVLRAAGACTCVGRRPPVNEVPVFLVGSDHLRLLRDGALAFPAMLAAIAAARREVFLEMYWIGADAIGERFRDALAERARAGVEVRVVYDALGSLGVSTGFWDPLLTAGGKVREFHALSPFDPTFRLDRLEKRDPPQAPGGRRRGRLHRRHQPRLALGAPRTRAAAAGATT